MLSAWEWHAAFHFLFPEDNEETCHVFSARGQLTSMVRPILLSINSDTQFQAHKPTLTWNYSSSHFDVGFLLLATKSILSV